MGHGAGAALERVGREVGPGVNEALHEGFHRRGVLVGVRNIPDTLPNSGMKFLA